MADQSLAPYSLLAVAPTAHWRSSVPAGAAEKPGLPLSSGASLGETNDGSGLGAPEGPAVGPPLALGEIRGRAASHAAVRSAAVSARGRASSTVVPKPRRYT